MKTHFLEHLGTAASNHKITNTNQLSFWHFLENDFPIQDSQLHGSMQVYVESLR